MHDIQKKILRLAHEKNLGQLTLRKIGELIGEPDRPQKIKHHLNQLQKKGLLRIDKTNALIERTKDGVSKGFLKKGKLFGIPILGSANAGPALRLADENIEGYLRVSSRLLGRNSTNSLFALKVDGSSMNRAEIHGKRIEDGDFVIIDSSYNTPREGDIVLSIIDNMANIKFFHHDRANNQIVLLSESSQNISPIHLHENDEFTVKGKVIQVIKKPRSK